jgi:amino acid transporter
MADQAVGAPSAHKLSGSLGVPSIVFMVVAAAAPLTVIAGVVPIGFLVGNGAGFPAMFVVAALILLLFAFGFTAMTRSVPKAGAFFTYIAHGLGRPSGLAGAYLALLCYLAVEVGVFGYVGAATRDAILRADGPEITWWVFSAIIIAAVGALGFRHIELSSKVLAILLVLEISIVLLVSLAVVFSGGKSGLDAKPFDPDLVTSGSPSLALMFAIAGFIGFEATAIFRDEAHDPDRTVPRATFLAVIIIGVFYAFSSWALVMAWGSDEVVAAAAEDPAGFVVNTAMNELGTFGEVAVTVLLITSVFAAALSFHNIIARYLHTMSTAGLLPKPLAGVHGRHRSPSAASLTTTLVAAGCLAICIVAGMDPYLKIFAWFVGVGSLCIIILMAATCLAVIRYFRGRDGESQLRVLVAPLLGLVGLATVAVVTAKNFPLLVGDVDDAGSPRFGAVSIGLLVLIGAVIVIGYVQAFVLRSRRSPSYDRIVDALS